MVSNYDYVTGVMGLDRQMIINTPKILTARQYRLRSRHQFLLYRGAAEYDPARPGYVSLADLIDDTDEWWCAKVARTTVQEYDDFLRSIWDFG